MMSIRVMITLYAIQRDENVMAFTIVWIGVMKRVVVSILLEKRIPVSTFFQLSQKSAKCCTVFKINNKDTRLTSIEVGLESLLLNLRTFNKTFRTLIQCINI